MRPFLRRYGRETQPNRGGQTLDELVREQRFRADSRVADEEDRRTVRSEHPGH